VITFANNNSTVLFVICVIIGVRQLLHCLIVKREIDR
jgi:hypothetical protein